jgi:hypothetical protein
MCAKATAAGKPENSLQGIETAALSCAARTIERRGNARVFSPYAGGFRADFGIASFPVAALPARSQPI